MRATTAAVALAVAVSLGCAGVLDKPGPQADEAVGGCFDRPSAPFGPDNYTDPTAQLARGDRAPDFALEDVDGQTHRLSELLKSKPVVLVLGNYTCPVYQKRRSKLDELQRKLGSAVHVVLVYGPEAHPRTDPSPYRGDVWSKPDKYSHMDEPTTFAERVEHARRLEGSPGVLTLVEPLDNPIWCSYATAPNAAFLIRQDGIVDAVHVWFDPKTMVESVVALTGEKRPRR